MKVTAAVLAATIGLAAAVEPPTHTKQPPKPPGPPHDKPKGPLHPPPYGPSKKPHPPGKPTKTGAYTASSTAAPTGLPPVDSKALQDAISVDNLRAKAEHLESIAYATDDRNRVIGSAGFNNTVDWLYESVSALGDYWTVRRQPFTALYSNVQGDITVDGRTFEPSFFEYSPGGTVTGELVPVADLGCEESDYPAEVEGNIALISRGECPFGQKSALAGVAGAAGAVIYNNAPAPLGGGTLGPPPNPLGDYVPTLGISQANGTSYIERIANGEVIEATLDIDSDLYNITVENVIAETVGGNKDSVLVIGGHSDSVFAGPGINDDGSGIIGILEVAEQLTGYAVNNAVRIAFWAAEEFGLLGSWHYTEDLSEEEAAKIRLYLNFDMIASPNYILGIYDGDGSAFNQTGPAGSAEAEAFFEDFFADNGLNSVPTDFSGRSDYAGFLARGIASGGLFTGAEVVKTEEEAELFGGEAGVSYDINYHQAGDNVTNLAWDAFEWNTKAIAAAVAEYATSFESLGPANNTVAANRKRSALAPHTHNHEGGCSKKIQ